MLFEKIKSNKNGFFLKVNNFKFRFKKRNDKTEYYQCVSCKVSVKLDLRTSKLSNLGEFKNQDIYPTHHHSDHKSSIDNSKFRNDIKCSIKDNLNKTVRSSFNNSLIKNIENFNHLQLFDQLKSGLLKFKNNQLPKSPLNLDDLKNIDEQYVNLPNEEQFLQINFSENSNERIICFFTHDFLAHLCNSKVVFSDGTFKKCPHLFSQLFIISFEFKGKIIPAIYCLLPNKSKETYTKLFQLLEDHADMFQLNFYPEEFSCDFESGLLSCIREKYRETLIKGCLFHMNQCFFRHLQSIGLASVYNSDNNFKSIIRKINALPLLPVTKIEEAFESIETQLSQFTNLKDKVDALLSYYKNTWLNPNAICSKELWNKYREHKRTNNDSEGINNKINSIIDQDHPHFYILIKALMAIQIDYQMQLNYLDKGGSFPVNEKYKKINDKLDQLWEDLEEEIISVDEFLDKAQHLLSKTKFSINLDDLI